MVTNKLDLRGPLGAQIWAQEIAETGKYRKPTRLQEGGKDKKYEGNTAVQLYFLFFSLFCLFGTGIYDCKPDVGVLEGLTVANAHDIFASSCTWKSLARRAVSRENAVSSFSSDCFASANAHTMFVRPCTLNSLARRAASPANVVNNLSSDSLAVANAHVMMARCCAWNSLTRHYASFANAVHIVFGD